MLKLRLCGVFDFFITPNLVTTITDISPALCDNGDLIGAVKR
jgi:hypothetical protein